MALDPARLTEIMRPHVTVSDKIRALSAAGVPRADIARFLGKRYQHVRNVLEGDAQSGGGYVLGQADLSGVQEGPRTFERPSDERAFVQARGKGAYRLVVRPDGSILLPKEVAQAFGADPDQVIMGRLEGEEFKLISARTAMERVRAWVRGLKLPPDVNLADDLIADRRAEADSDEARD